MLDKLRLLPFLMVVAVGVLGFRVDSIWAQAKDVAKEAAEQAASEAATAEPAADAAAAAADQPAEGAETAAESPPEGGHMLGSTEVKGVDPLIFNDSELDILQSLSERREVLDERERQIEKKEGLLTIAEQRIEQKIAELKQLQAAIESTRSEVEKMSASLDSKNKTQLAGLVKTYESMKPKEAARIFDLMDMPVLLDVIDQMKEAKMAPILASMDPAKAKTVTTELAKKSVMPGFSGVDGASAAAKPVPPPPPGSN